MKRIFYPATALMNRLSFLRRFLLLGSLFFLAIGVLAANLFATLEVVIQSSHQRLESVQLVQPMSRLIKAIQFHRGLSAGVIVGNSSLALRLPAQRREADAALAALLSRLPGQARTNADWSDLQQDWRNVVEFSHAWSAEQNMAAHSHIIEDLRLLEAVHTQSGDADVFFLLDVSTRRLPAVIEHLGRLRAAGTSILSRQNIADTERRQIIGIIANLNDSLTNLSAGLDKSAQHNPDLAAELHKAADTLTIAARSMISLVEADIVSGRLSSWPDTYLDRMTAAIDQSYEQIYRSLLPAAEERIRRRIASAGNVFHISVGAALLLFLVCGYLIIGMYFATVDNLRALAASARAFAAGDFSTPVHLDTGDELKQIGHSFDEMAQGFSALLVERRGAEEKLRAAAAEVQDLYDNAPCGYHSLDKDGVIVKINKTELLWLGYERQELVGKLQWCSLLAAGSAGSCAFALERLARDGAVLDQELQVRRKDGTVFAGLVNAAAVYDADGKFLGSRATMYDITERQRSADRICHMAHHDALTGLPNRLLMADRLAQDLKKAHRLGQKVALLFIDLDRFKEVNDTLGHDTGDLLLQDAAQRIVECVRESDTVARLGGDEFTVILTGLESVTGIGVVGERILEQISRPFVLGDETAYISASIGVTVYPDDANCVEDLLKDADQAMYAAKSAGRNRMSYFTADLQRSAQARVKMIADLRVALSTGQFCLHYQPIVDLNGGRIYRGEALLRWLHPTAGLISPAQFIPLAEETGLIVELGHWVFGEAARQVQHWRQLVEPNLQISINVSPVQFRHDSGAFAQWICCLRERGLDNCALGIEITEGLLLEAEDGVRQQLHNFRSAGVHVAVDDFGTGYSALAYLKKFDIDVLKIDRSFVADLADDANDRALCEAIIAMAHKLGLQVVAEGVETAAQRDLLSAWKCDFAQGYLFSRPLPAAQFEALLCASRTG